VAGIFLNMVFRTAKRKLGGTYFQDLSDVNGDCRVRDNIQSLCILYQDTNIFSLLAGSGIWIFGVSLPNRI
jgi:hypothetical protein